MNEKKLNSRFVSKPTSKEDIRADDLKNQVMYVIKNAKLQVTDWILLDKMLNQLKNPKSNYSRKVLRSMEAQLQNIQCKYQRG